MLRRRTFLARIAIGAGAALGFTRRVVEGLALSAFEGVAQGVLRFRPLARPVVVPLDDLATPGRARPFMADAVTLASAANPNQPIRVSGLIARIRRAGGAGGSGGSGQVMPDQFSAVCARCPHEGCDVDFVAEPGKLPPDTFAAIGGAPDEPVYMCPCHNSTFKVEDGSRLAGPAPRGLYRFRVTGVAGGTVQIGEVEEDVLIFDN